MQKNTCFLLLITCCFLTGCSTPNPGKSLEEIQKSANQGIDKGAQSAKDLAEKAIDIGTTNMNGASKEIAQAAADKAKEKINEEIDKGNSALKGIASGAVGKIGDTVNKTNDSVKSAIDTAKDTSNKVVDTAKNTVDQAKTVVVGGYTIYSQTAVDTALKAGKNVVLFFHASWCPSCKSLDQDILANKAKIPSDTVIFKVDYDLNTTLKTKYGVTSQHTLVSLNSDGTKKSFNRNSPTLADVVKNK